VVRYGGSWKRPQLIAAERGECSIHRGDFTPFAMDRFEPENLARLFEYGDRQIAEHSLDALEPTVYCDRIA
jgi:hypothetical protein